VVEQIEGADCDIWVWVSLVVSAFEFGVDNNSWKRDSKELIKY
jgi:hypothetical protein